jgi:hypothetical protein
VGLLWMLIDLTYIQNISVKRIRYGFSTSFYDKNYLPVFFTIWRVLYIMMVLLDLSVFWECRSNQLTSIIIPLGRHLRFYVINFRKLINVYIFAYPEYRFVQCPSHDVLYFGRLTFADCTVTKNRLKNSNIFMTFNEHDV